MKLFSKLCIAVFALLLSSNTFAQKDSCNLSVSLLTMGSGEEIYSIFGHSALRITDRTNNIDVVYNYGMFDFDDPLFLPKFIRGSLLYFSAAENFRDFYYEYQAEQRSIDEQVLNLSCDEKQKLFAALQKNALPENRNYLYNSYYDNCSTRLRDIVEQNSPAPFVTKNFVPKPGTTTIRDLMYECFDSKHLYWTKLGMDILMGVPADKRVSTKEAMFLPINLERGFDSTTINGAPLVISKRTIYQPADTSKPLLLRPMLVFIVLFILIGVCSIMKSRATIIFLRIFDTVFFLAVGLVGSLAAYMWFGTIHVECQVNLSILWALPTHVIMAFFTRSNKNWVKSYFKLTSWLSLLLLIFWFFLPQSFNISLIPVVAILFIRSQALSRKKTTAQWQEQ